MGSILIILIVFLAIKFLGDKFRNKAIAMVSIYVAILFVTTVVFYFLPSTETEAEPIDALAITDEEYYREYDRFYEKVSTGDLEAIDSRYLEEKREYEYDGSELTIDFNKQEFGGSVKVERKDSNDSKIEVYLYKTKTYVDGLDMTESINNLSFDLSGDTLLLKNPSKSAVKFTKFEEAFTVTQFNGEGNRERHYSTNFGDQVLYVRVPKDMKIESNLEGYVEYVGE